MRFFQKFRKLNNKGFSLVELVCGIAILSIIAVTVASVMIVSANSYSQGSAEAEVQQEAQLVANQISDLLIDSTTNVQYDAATETLQIDQGNKRYLVARNASSKELEYTEAEVDQATNLMIDTTIKKQVLATGVERFDASDVNSADFAKTGYTRLSIEFENGGQTYNANYGITARNKDAGNGSGVTAAIILPSEITLEPNEEYTFTPSVVGLAITDVNWEIESNNDADTEMVGNKVVIGNDEDANVVRLHCKSAAMNGLNPAADAWVNVYIRRVTDVTIIGECINGVSGQIGAKYKLTAKAIGRNTPQVLGVDYDDDTKYKDPSVINWLDGPFTGYTVTKDPSDDEIAYVELTSGLVPGSSISVMATAAHPAGANKMNIPYDSVTETWTLNIPNNIPGLPNNGGWKRQSNDPQSVGLSTLINNAKQPYDSDGDPNTNAGFIVRYSFREVIDKDANLYGPYEYVPAGQQWIYNTGGYGTDGNASDVINLRPALTGTLIYNKPYEVHIQLLLIDPTKSVGDTGYVMQILGELCEIVPAVGVEFDSTVLGLTNATKNAPITYPNTAGASVIRWGDNRGHSETILKMSNLIGIDEDGNSVTNNLNFICEMWNGTEWTGEIPNYVKVENKNGECFFKFDGNSDMNNGGANYDDIEGLYRIKVEIANQPNKTVDVANNRIVDLDPAKTTYVMWDETTGEGIYYFYVDDPNKTIINFN